MSDWKTYQEILPEIGQLMIDDPESGYKRVERRWKSGKSKFWPAKGWGELFDYADDNKYRIKPRTIELQEECKKSVDLSVCIKSGIDMEFLVNFGATEYWVVAGPLREISSNRDYYFDGGPAATCRPRLHHWNAWQGGDCPVPEGVMGDVLLRNGVQSNNRNLCRWKWKHDSNDSDIIAWRATGLADGYCWLHELESTS